MGAGAAEGAVDASNILKPSLARGEIQCIGATTLDDYRKYVERDPALERRLQPVRVEAPSDDDTVAILMGVRSKYEEHHKVDISDEAIRSAALLAQRYIPHRRGWFTSPVARQRNTSFSQRRHASIRASP